MIGLGMDNHHVLNEGTAREIIQGHGDDPRQLVAALLDIQAASGRNYVDMKWASLVSAQMGVPLPRVFDALTFYPMFSTEPRGRYLIEICRSAPCRFCGTSDVAGWIESTAGIKIGQTSVDEMITLAYTNCVGACAVGPAVKIGDDVFGDLNEEKVAALIARCREGGLEPRPDAPPPGGEDPASVSEYVKAGGFDALRKAAGMSGEAIVAELKDAGLLGRQGEEARPAGEKWERLLRSAETQKHVVCNAGEGEPGTFKDRLVLDRHPLRLVEGMTIAAFALGATAGHIHVRGEYRELRKRLIRAIGNARRAGFLGANILGARFDFDISVGAGAGAYVCGEESALLNSVEGKIGRPGILPADPAEAGLFQKPTLIDSAESFADIPAAMGAGGDRLSQTDSPDSGGTKLVCLSGHVRNRGTFEIPLGRLTLREIIYGDGLGGGIAGGKSLKFFQIGGQGGPIGSPDLLDTVYGYADLKKAGLSVGSGAIAVMDDTVSVIDYLKCVIEFFIRESCGKCVPCREGTRHLLDILNRPPGSRNPAGDPDTLRRLIRTVADASFCGLGRAATVALGSARERFGPEFGGTS